LKRIVKEEHNKDSDILKKKQKLWKWKVQQINKNSVNILSSRMGQVEDRMLGIKDKAHLLEQSYEEIWKQKGNQNSLCCNVQMEHGRIVGQWKERLNI
jgi:hypothetical protein